MTTRINLLPWREIRRREKDRQLLSASIATWILAAVAVFYAQWYMNDMIDHQQNRNGYLRTEIAKLDKQIKEIEDLKRRKDRLLARMEIIQRLQSDRTQIVQVGYHHQWQGIFPTNKPQGGDGYSQQAPEYC